MTWGFSFPDTIMWARQHRGPWRFDWSICSSGSLAPGAPSNSAGSALGPDHPRHLPYRGSGRGSASWEGEHRDERRPHRLRHINNARRHRCGVVFDTPHCPSYPGRYHVSGPRQGPVRDAIQVRWAGSSAWTAAARGWRGYCLSASVLRRISPSRVSSRYRVVVDGAFDEFLEAPGRDGHRSLSPLAACRRQIRSCSGHCLAISADPVDPAV